MADVNLDQSVDETDIGLLANSFGDTTAGPRIDGNLNDDGVVNGKDLGILLSDFNNPPAVSGPLGVTFASAFNPVDPNALAADPQLAGATTIDLSFSSLTDVLVVETELTVVGGSLFQLSEGSDTGPLSPIITDILPAGLADSWVASPGPTLVVGPMALEIGTLATRFDGTFDGPQTDFQFARFTLVPDTPGGQIEGSIRAKVQTRTDTPFPQWDVLEFSFAVPEPHSLVLVMMCVLGALPMVRRRR